MTLKVECLDLIRQITEAGLPPIHEVSVKEARARSARTVRLSGDRRRVGSVEPHSFATIDGAELQARLYRPSPGTRSPLIVYYHGGGWMQGSLETADAACRELCMESAMNLVSIDYRLSPEHKFPVAVEDAWSALLWAVSSHDALGGDGRIILAGDSSGGNLAAVTALRARDEGGPEIAHQLLVYPVTDHSFETPSYLSAGQGLLTADTMKYFWQQYLENDLDGDNPYASPLRARDHTRLPAATVVVAEYDPLHDEGLAYAQRLKHAGVEVAVLRFDGMIHGFWSLLGALPTGREAIRMSAQRLRSAFGPSSG
jgi:acetyl esterase